MRFGAPNPDNSQDNDVSRRAGGVRGFVFMRDEPIFSAGIADTVSAEFFVLCCSHHYPQLKAHIMFRLQRIAFVIWMTPR